VSPVVFRGDGNFHFQFLILDFRFSISNSGVNMTEMELKARTKQLGLRVLKLVDALPSNRAGRIISNQLGRSGTSVGANYRAACRARSRADFYSKLGIVEEELDESCYWMEMIVEGGLLKPSRIERLYEEANELLAIVVASRCTISRADRNGGGNQKSKIKNQKWRPLYSVIPCSFSTCRKLSLLIMIPTVRVSFGGSVPVLIQLYIISAVL
jgi:four helix bundle protein